MHDIIYNSHDVCGAFRQYVDISRVPSILNKYDICMFYLFVMDPYLLSVPLSESL